jgi:hypothetical protein
MMKFISVSRKQADYSSLIWRDSKVAPGVRYATRRVSLMQRIELTRRVRELALGHEFLKAGDVAQQLEATIADLLVRKLYLEWGLAEIRGLRIDGETGTIETLLDKGPEALSYEIVAAIRTELEISEDERKNF